MNRCFRILLAWVTDMTFMSTFALYLSHFFCHTNLAIGFGGQGHAAWTGYSEGTSADAKRVDVGAAVFRKTGHEACLGRIVL